MLPEALQELRRRVAALERRQRDTCRTGEVVAVDAARGLLQVMLRGGDTPFVTDWIPWEEPAAGSLRTHLPPALGEQVRVQSEAGDMRDATVQGRLNSSLCPRPSAAPDEYVLGTVGEARIAILGNGAGIEFRVGPSVITLTAQGIVLEGPRIDLN